MAESEPSVISAILARVREFIALRGVQLFARWVSKGAIAVGAVEYVKEDTAAMIASGVVALVLVGVDMLSHSLQKRGA
jgi:hypothetical protein